MPLREFEKLEANYQLNVLAAKQSHKKSKRNNMPNTNPFENIKQTNERGAEFWYARDLQKVLEYQTWDKFKKVIDKVIIACKQSKIKTVNHFSQLGKMVSIGFGAEREVEILKTPMPLLRLLKACPFEKREHCRSKLQQESFKTHRRCVRE